MSSVVTDTATITTLVPLKRKPGRPPKTDVNMQVVSPSVPYHCHLCPFTGTDTASMSHHCRSSRHLSLLAKHNPEEYQTFIREFPTFHCDPCNFVTGLATTYNKHMKSFAHMRCTMDAHLRSEGFSTLPILRKNAPKNQDVSQDATTKPSVRAHNSTPKSKGSPKNVGDILVPAHPQTVHPSPTPAAMKHHRLSESDRVDFYVDMVTAQNTMKNSSFVLRNGKHGRGAFAQECNLEQQRQKQWMLLRETCEEYYVRKLCGNFCTPVSQGANDQAGEEKEEDLVLQLLEESQRELAQVGMRGVGWQLPPTQVILPTFPFSQVNLEEMDATAAAAAARERDMHRKRKLTFKLESHDETHIQNKENKSKNIVTSTPQNKRARSKDMQEYTSTVPLAKVQRVSVDEEEPCLLPLLQPVRSSPSSASSRSPPSLSNEHVDLSPFVSHDIISMLVSSAIA